MRAIIAQRESSGSCQRPGALCLLRMTEQNSRHGGVGSAGVTLQEWEAFVKKVRRWGFRSQQHDPSETLRRIFEGTEATGPLLARVCGVRSRQILETTPQCSCGALMKTDETQEDPQELLLELQMPDDQPQLLLSELLCQAGNGETVEVRRDSCPTCGTPPICSKTIGLLGVHDVILIALQRWRWNRTTNMQERLTTLAHPDPVLHVAGATFQRKAVACHYGAEAIRGHYIAFATDTDAAFRVYQYNDDVVSASDTWPAERLAHARLLAYERAVPTPPSAPTTPLAQKESVDEDLTRHMELGSTRSDEDCGSCLTPPNQSGAGAGLSCSATGITTNDAAKQAAPARGMITASPGMPCWRSGALAPVAAATSASRWPADVRLTAPAAAPAWTAKGSMSGPSCVQFRG